MRNVSLPTKSSSPVFSPADETFLVKCRRVRSVTRSIFFFLVQKGGKKGLERLPSCRALHVALMNTQ